MDQVARVERLPAWGETLLGQAVWLVPGGKGQPGGGDGSSGRTRADGRAYW